MFDITHRAKQLAEFPGTIPDDTVAPAPVESEEHVGLSLVSRLGASLIPADARRGPLRARATFRAVA